MQSHESYILHIDGDAFFAQCECAQFPHLRGKPVVVGQERGIAVAFTYEAKALGITRAMPIFKIRKEFPQVIILPSHFELYKMYSAKFIAIVRRFIHTVEEYSIDECFAEITFSEAKSWEEAEVLARKIKEAVQKETGLTFSFGLARTKGLAKIASKKEKPDGCTVMTPEKETAYLESTPIDKVWGVGYRTAPRLSRIGITTARHLRDLPESFVQKHFAKPLEELWCELRGIRLYSCEHTDEDPHSLQATRTFTPASSDPKLVFSELSKNIETACIRLRREKLLTNHVSVFIKTSEFKYRTTECHLTSYTDNPVDILKVLRPHFDSIFDSKFRYRASGITLLSLRPKSACTNDLFGEQKSTFKQSTVMHAIDRLRDVYGKNVVFLGSSMNALLRRNSETEKQEKKNSVPYQWNLPLPYMGEVA